MTVPVPLDDPRRHIRIRLRAAQILVHALWAGLWPEGRDLARSTASGEFGGESEVFTAVLTLLHEYADEPVAITQRLRDEIAYLTLCLEDIRADGK